jgi:hypothetical protein
MTRRRFVLTLAALGLIAGCSSEASKPSASSAPPADPKAPPPKVGGKPADRIRRAAN